MHLKWKLFIAQGRTEAGQAKPLTQSTTAYLHPSNIIGLQGNIIDLVYTSYIMVYIMHKCWDCYIVHGCC